MKNPFPSSSAPKVQTNWSSRSQEIKRKNEEKILAHRLSFASLAKKVSRVKKEAHLRSREIVSKSLGSNRKRAEQMFNLALIDKSIMEETRRTITSKIVKRISKKITGVKTEASQRVV